MKTIRGKVMTSDGLKTKLNPDSMVRVGVWAIDVEDEVKTLASVYPRGVTDLPFEFTIDVDESELKSLQINSICIDVSVETRGAVDFKPIGPTQIAQQLDDGSILLKDNVDVIVAPLKRL